ncbi:PspC domain-containing protein [Sphingomonas sp. LaA6.9]|uniref:PspC domain-containing protein n=1 Tax=Sphingomonas sp. LaA6.9 TaxID=2919914 RepID=UPI001F4F5758|nr:PspC domain-containing protein [Sphingomonas sp. LaA6.9]MCJ8156441.1 PspC domain-containing protein [Sphingomonas sp. LaA6.9]
MSVPYALDKANAKIMGVCAGFARSSGIDVMIVRIALVLATIFALGPVAVLIYLLVGWIASEG